MGEETEYQPTEVMYLGIYNNWLSKGKYLGHLYEVVHDPPWIVRTSQRGSLEVHFPNFLFQGSVSCSPKQVLLWFCFPRPLSLCWWPLFPTSPSELVCHRVCTFYRTHKPYSLHEDVERKEKNGGFPLCHSHCIKNQHSNFRVHSGFHFLGEFRGSSHE